MGLYFVLICSLLAFNSIYATNSIEPTDESILDKIIRADQQEGTEQILNQEQSDLLPHKRREEEIKQSQGNLPTVRSRPSFITGDELSDDVRSPPPLTSLGKAKTIADDHVYFPPEENTEEQEDKTETKETKEDSPSTPEDKPKPNCLQPYETGPCRASIPRFYFNVRSKKCEPFTYGGCKGNGNNYKTKEDCARICSSQRQFGNAINST